MELAKIHEVFDKKFDSIDDMIDHLELDIMKHGEENFDVDHCFTPGLYTRTIFMPTDSLVVSKIHKTEHQYFVLAGKALVFTEEEGWVEITAPYRGVTKPGTRRVLIIVEDMLWGTSHPTDKKTVEEVEDDIIEKRENILLTEHKKEQVCLG